MMMPSHKVRILVATQPVDFRKGHDGLAAMVQSALKEDPFTGTVFVFRAKRADRLKILFWDGSGLVLTYKRLEETSFTWPVVRDGVMTHVGQVGDAQTVESGYESAKVCALNTLANLKAAVGSLDKIKRLVYVGGYVNAVAGFAESPAVINGASDLFIEVLGEAGRHARAAVAVAGLPKDSTVEIQVVAEIGA